MAKIHTLEIQNFRSIKSFKHTFTNDFNCLIGRGDSGKSTILEAIASVLSSSWNLQFFDNDFHNCDTSLPITIEVTLIDFPDEFLKEEKFGLLQRGITKENEISDEIEDFETPALTIRLEVAKELEPKWYVLSPISSSKKEISANDRGKLNTFLVSDYLERHFTWTKGGPLYSLLKLENVESEDGVMLEPLREAKTKIDSSAFTQFETTISKIKNMAEQFGLSISGTKSTIDFKEILIKEGKVSLHDQAIPFRLKGKGSKRLISMAIQANLAKNGGIILIDEIEQGLEPDRVQNLVNTLKKLDKGQVFVTTHSRDVVVELDHQELTLMKENAQSLVRITSSLQGLIRSNPEILFARRALVCEGATELGIIRAMNEYRIENSKPNMAYLGVRSLNGGGRTMDMYCMGLREIDFPTALFCDSDDPTFNTVKAKLKSAQVELFDWSSTDSIEEAIFKSVTFDILKRAFKLAVELKYESGPDKTKAEYEKSLWESVVARMPTGYSVSDISSVTDSPALRDAIGKTAKTKEWYKRQDKSYRLGKLLFTHFDKISSTEFGKQMTKLSDWIDSNEP